MCKSVQTITNQLFQMAHLVLNYSQLLLNNLIPPKSLLDNLVRNIEIARQLTVVMVIH